MKNNTKTTTAGERTRETYAVFGPGWGGEYLQTYGNVIGSGRLVYRGHSLAQAKRKLAAAKRGVAQLRKRPDMRNASDTYSLYRLGENGWAVYRDYEEGE
jgi:hypothetical protein